MSHRTDGAAAEPGKFLVQRRVLRALMTREIVTRYGRTPGGYAWAILDPVAMIAVLTVIFDTVARSPALGDSFMLFFATGYLGFLFYRSISNYASKALTVNRPLFNFPRVTPFDAIVVRIYLQYMTDIAVAIVVLGGIFILNNSIPELRIEYILIGMAMGVILGAGAAMVNSILFILYPMWERIFAVINRPLFLISGIFYTPESLPSFAADILWWNPLLHVVSIFRQGFYPDYSAPLSSPIYLWFWCIATLTYGLWLLHRYRYAVIEQ